MRRFVSSRLAAAALIFAVAFVLFGGTCRFGFLDHDDTSHLSGNPRMRVLTTQAVAAYWKKPYLDLYIPVTYTYWSGLTALSYALDGKAEVPKIRPWLFHLSNILLHGANGGLVFLLLAEFGLALGPALAGALFFVMHPIQVEPVAWVSGAKDVLSGFFGLGALLWYAKFLRRSANQDAAATAYGVAYAAFTVAILAKPAEVILPPLFVLMALYYDRRWRWRSLWLVLPHLLTVGVYLWIASVSQETEGTFPPVPLWARPLIAGDAWLFYLQKVWLPFGFAVDYGRHSTLVLGSTKLLVRAVAPYLLALWLLWQWHRRPTPALGFGCLLLAGFAVALAPTLGFLQFSYQFFSMVCDRYAYLAMVVPAIAVAVAVKHGQTWRGFKLTAALIAVFLCWQTTRLVETWRDERSLFGHSIATEPRGAIALVGVSNDTFNQGDFAGTIPLLQAAAAALPTWSRPHNNLGTTYMHLHQPADAVVQYRQALVLYPDNAMTYSNLCAALDELGRNDEALLACRESIRLAPENTNGYTNYGAVLKKVKRHAEASANFHRAVDLAPHEYAPRYYWAISLVDEGKIAEALAELSTLHRQYPTNINVVLDMGDCYRKLGQVDAAVKLFSDYSAGAANPRVKAIIQEALTKLVVRGTAVEATGTGRP